MRARLLTRFVRLAVATVALGACSLDPGGALAEGSAGAGGEPPSSSTGAAASTSVGSTSSGASSAASTAVGASVGGASSSSSAGGANAGGGGAMSACSGPGTFEEPIGKHCYELNDPAEQLPWDQARQACLVKGNGWDLAVVTTIEEVAFLDGQLTGVDHLWIGGQDVPPSDDAVFAWIDGWPWSFDSTPGGSASRTTSTGTRTA